VIHRLSKTTHSCPGDGQTEGATQLAAYKLNPERSITIKLEAEVLGKRPYFPQKVPKSLDILKNNLNFMIFAPFLPFNLEITITVRSRYNKWRRRWDLISSADGF
jgi:hypothetical protein